MSQQINLLAPNFRKKRVSLTSAAAIVCGIGIAVFLALLVAFYEDYQLRGVELEAREVSGALKEAALAHEKATGEKVLRKPNAELEARIRELTAQLKGRQEIIDALNTGAVGSTGGFSEYMRVFSRQSVEGLWLTAFDLEAGGSHLSMAGRALNADLVPAYLQRLNREAPMQGRQFASMVINRSVPAREPVKGPQEMGQGKEAPAPTLPAHVEFIISSGDVVHAKARLAASPAAPRSAPPPPLPRASSEGGKPDTRPEGAK